jgi:hypothetical protein
MARGKQQEWSAYSFSAFAIFSIPQMWKRYIACTLAGLAGLLVILYIGDYVVLRLRMSNGSGLGEMTVHRYYAVQLKSGKIDFLPADPQQQTCTQSLFPHMGDPPCWYLAQHTDQRIDM